MKTKTSQNRVFLMILDGFGLRQETQANAVKLANTPFLKGMYERWAWTSLNAIGRAVGLPEGLMGNSEVGHLNLGAGRIVNQEINRINLAIENGSFNTKPELLDSIKHAKTNGGVWHLIGLVSDGGVHSSLDHLYALLRLTKSEGLDKVYIHALMDGRDASPHGGRKYIRQVEEQIQAIGVGQIATMVGRYWGMDRDTRWERVERAYKMLIEGIGNRYHTPSDAIEDSYLRAVTDEFLEPAIILNGDDQPHLIKPDDSVFFFNFRADRAREITLALMNSDEAKFPHRDLNLHLTTLTHYRDDFASPVVFKPVPLKNILGEVLSNRGLKQFRTAETEKYAHVTYFFNGGRNDPFPGEEQHLEPSPRVATYDMQPEMSAPKVAEAALAALDEDFSFMLLNFANPDMVGHTGILRAAIQALEALDPLVRNIVKKAQSQGFTVMITADHGNCELMATDEGPHTAHTTNRVPLVMIPPDDSKPALRDDGILGDVAPTVLEIMGIPQPPEMTAKSLLK